MSEGNGKPRSSAEAERAFHEESGLGNAYDSRLLARLWPFVRPYRWQLALALALMPVCAELLVAQPRMLQRVIDEGVLGGDLGAINRLSLAILGLIAVEQLGRFVGTYLLQVVGQRSMAALRHHAFAFLERQRMAFFDRQPIGRLVTRVTNDIDALGELFASGAVTAVGDFFTLARIVVAMLAFSPRLSLYTFAAVPPLVLLVDLFRRRAREAFREIRAKTARMNAYLSEQVQGVSVVQAYGQEARCQEEFGAINAAYRDANLISIRYDALLYAVVEAFSSVCVATLLFMGARSLGMSAPAASLGVLVAFVQFIQRFFEPLRDLSSKWTLVQSAMAAAERVFGLLDQPEEDAPGRPQARPPEPDPAAPLVAFEAVGFGYSEARRTLQGVTFAVPRGRTVALVGATGAGKTTVVALLQRLYEVDQGSIRLEGVDLRDLDREALRRRVVVVPQDVVLFPGDVLSNVALGDPAPDSGRVARIARELGLEALLTRRGEGLGTPVTDRGQNFSAGERQLLALARALYRDPEVLVLDEATSSLDSETEATVQAAIARALQGRTAIVIAHRLSTIRQADEILVFHRGSIAERGPHEHLLSVGGIYARLHRLQFEGNA
ncbi:MAG: ABC transporter ATP-binding protein [Deltaproteobacteria bacterium]|nr:ABC transporter ATP-binding protein [Deltaproteobacteria bacterium]